jgi:hypothetical protein
MNMLAGNPTVRKRDGGVSFRNLSHITLSSRRTFFGRAQNSKSRLPEIPEARTLSTIYKFKKALPLRSIQLKVIEISLEEVGCLIKKMKKGELPGITPFRVHVHLIEGFVHSWEELCLLAFRKVEVLLEETVRELCTGVFGRFRSSGLLSDVRQFSHFLAWV